MRGDRAVTQLPTQVLVASALGLLVPHPRSCPLGVWQGPGAGQRARGETPGSSHSLPPPAPHLERQRDPTRLLLGGIGTET